jgi:hypothetical protein
MNKEKERLAIIEQERIKNLTTTVNPLDPNSVEPMYVIGKNALDNWKIYKEASQRDTVFHLDGLTSPYVIVNRTMDELTTQIINTAADLCKSKSKHKHLHNLKVLYTSISNTRLGDAIGSFVVISNHKKRIVNI